MNKEKTYDAFISYRHLKMDEQMARSIQFMLETYRQPKGIAVGKKYSGYSVTKRSFPQVKIWMMRSKKLSQILNF